MNSKNILLRFVFLFTINGILATTFHIDPVNGSDTGDGTYTNPWKTLEYVIDNNLIESFSYITPYDPENPQLIIRNQDAPVKAGDILMLYNGMHGDIFIRNYINTDYITIKNVENHIPVLKRIHIQGGKMWRMEGLTISSEPYGTYINERLVFLESHNWHGPVSKIDITNCDIYSTLTPWIVAEDWVTKASDGIITKGDTMNIFNNTLTNVKFGISLSGNYLNAVGNTIKNFSKDGMRLNGSNNLVEANTIKNCYDVDSNHDDGIQSFTTGGLIVDNNIIRRNIILNYEDPNQPLLGSLQGIGCFDGPYHNWVIENNLVIVDHWHGISLYEAINCLIINNTVLDPTPDVSPGPSWIRIDDENGNSSTDCIVKNNTANSIQVTPNTISSNNTVLSTYSDYANNFTEYSNFDFHLLATSELIDAGDSNLAPLNDLEDNDRPSGDGFDVGAYEYQFPLSIDEISDKLSKIYPNPFINTIRLDGNTKSTNITVIDVLGNIIYRYPDEQLPYSLKLNSLEKGIYFVQIINNSDGKSYTNRIIKK